MYPCKLHFIYAVFMYVGIVDYKISFDWFSTFKPNSQKPICCETRRGTD